MRFCAVAVDLPAGAVAAALSGQSSRPLQTLSFYIQRELKATETSTLTKALEKKPWWVFLSG
jgi:hypothetical protein